MSMHSMHAEIIGPWSDGVQIRTGPITWNLLACQSESKRILEHMGTTRDIYTQIEMDEKNMYVLGFFDETALILYQALVHIDRVGRSIAFAALESGNPQDTLRAISAKDKGFLTSLDSIGPKRAETLIQEVSRVYKKAMPRPLPCPVKEWIEARELLMDSRGVDFDQAEDMLFEQFELLKDK